MFPLDQPTAYYLIQIGVLLFSSLAMQFGMRWGLLLLIVALAVPAGSLWYDPPSGEYAGLGYILKVIVSLVALAMGAFLGLAVRTACKASLTSVAVLFIINGALASLILWNQYIPSACLETPLQVQIAGRVMHLPSEMRPIIERGKSTGFFGRADRKSDSSWLCRKGRNGSKIIDVDTVSINPVSSHKTITQACKSDEPPTWCNSYSPEPFRRIGEIRIAPVTDRAFPMSYWTTPSGSLKKDRQGDLTRGSVCLSPDPKHGPLTQCWIWQPFGDGARLTVSTYNLDPIFNDMPIEEAREMIRNVRKMALEIITQ